MRYCNFVLGFQTIHDQIPDTFGNCVVDQHHDPVNGDALKETTGGMLVWRKADNFTAFADGYRSWVKGPYGLLQRLNTARFDWESGGSQPSTEAAPVATAPAPQATPLPSRPQPTSTPTAVLAKPGAPAGAFAICRDGTYSYGQSRSGTCSSHGGVGQWLN